jgi:hypothetical protein
MAQVDKVVSEAVTSVYGKDGPAERFRFQIEYPDALAPLRDWLSRRDQPGSDAKPMTPPRRRRTRSPRGPSGSPPDAPPIPPIEGGEIKPHNRSGFYRGMRQLGEREIADARWATGNVGLFTYDVGVGTPIGSTAPVYLQVFGPRTGPDREVIWAGPIGSVPVPQAATPQIRGNLIEPRVRALAAAAMRLIFQAKHPSAPGADLVPVPLGGVLPPPPLRLSLRNVRNRSRNVRK